MNNSQKILKMISGFIEAGLIASKDLRKELLTSIKFKKEDLASRLDLVSKDEFVILKKIIDKQQKEINDLKSKQKKLKKAKRS